MNLCIINGCQYYSSLNSDKCSLHSKNVDTIQFKDLYKKFDKIVEKETINELEEKNIFNLIKKLPKNNITQITKIIIVYLKTINKEFINANLALRIYNLMINKVLKVSKKK